MRRVYSTNIYEDSGTNGLKREKAGEGMLPTWLEVKCQKLHYQRVNSHIEINQPYYLHTIFDSNFAWFHLLPLSHILSLGPIFSYSVPSFPT